ncbi:hypothetical protein [Caproicibacter fermentans]|uniref:Uncharacterized protein n=1 Tax=Caproicibacter fermentans TaxID=2576756 RepID=A0A7G8TE02_9FIRM|nr:hypothetical protein [Caproicibacter fermentans]QNK41843.1 hypothetical protein HCR03_06265 [Caproicibacter fermentans]
MEKQGSDHAKGSKGMHGDKPFSKNTAMGKGGTAETPILHIGSLERL